ncbi:unnamed protein product [Periconia digitata]|uniref:Uncharacterized protein n=1 Tax=Periconia digitata TaxID=1303443 RepID=A0A9W4UPG7_9PLEO|nr:unnamed protein product [Periconia digitata]
MLLSTDYRRALAGHTCNISCQSVFYSNVVLLRSVAIPGRHAIRSVNLGCTCPYLAPASSRRSAVINQPQLHSMGEPSTLPAAQLLPPTLCDARWIRACPVPLASRWCVHRHESCFVTPAKPRDRLFVSLGQPRAMPQRWWDRDPVCVCVPMLVSVLHRYTRNAPSCNRTTFLSEPNTAGARV